MYGPGAQQASCAQNKDLDKNGRYPREECVRETPDREFEYLCVDDYMRRMIDARALATAFEIGLIDTLSRAEEARADELAKRLGADDRGITFLLGLLAENGVIENRDGAFSLAGGFINALRFRDLMEMKLSLSNFAAHDFLELFSDLVKSPEGFMTKARFPHLFAYDRCFDSSEDDRRVTRQWMRVTTVLTKYESQACMKYHDFGCYERMLDVGGNSGEFALRLCRKHPALRADVFDLPLVCDVGMSHVGDAAEADRIRFVRGNAVTDDLPEDYDLVTFKSMLHDWPDHIARNLVKKGAGALKKGGTMVIFERASTPVIGTPGYSLLPFLVFFHSYRPPEFYVRCMKENGFINISSKIINLEMPFLLVTGVAGAQSLSGKGA
ncbi:MAG: hypothetical protein AVO39_09690 [delta proteobacterium MLS_D]|nr:MAG: hypothetical protein AVO39_09690 [delta proteobacterium MLS_D]